MLWMYHIPANSNVLDYYGDPNKPGAIPPGTDETSLAIWGKTVGQEYQPSRRAQNPWWTAYQYDNDDTRDRLLPSATLRYDITDFLWVQGRAGMDWYTRRETDLLPEGTGYQPGGVMKEFEYRVREINMEWMLGYDQAFGKFNINAFVGGNRMRRDNEMTLIRGNNFNVPFFAAITNTVLQRYEYNFSQSGINSLFGSAEVSYNNLLFLTGTVRNDWFSVLNPEFNSILYPSIGGSFVFSDALKTLPNWLSFGKVRASWAQVGNVTVDPYNTILTYSLKQPHVGIPLASFSTARGVSGSIPNPILQPLTSTEFEVGLDIRFFDNRLGLDFTYYNQETTDDILKAGISGASGFGTTVLNVGKIENRGIEALLTATPVSGPLTWDISFNFAKNTNKVVSLIEGIDELIVARPRTNTVFVKHIVGQPFGVLTGLVQKRSPDGQLVFDPNNGAPIESDEYEIIGNSVPDWTGGINNSFTFKGFNLGALVDFKIGGDIYSGTNVWMTQAGFHKQTIQGREGQEPITVSGVAQNGTDVNGDPTYEPFSRTLTPSEAQNYWSQMGNRVQDHFLYDASFAKLRQVTFGYIFPSSMLSKTPFRTLSLSFVARNLAILYNNVENIDPESSYQNGNGQGLDFFGMPQTRSYGFNLKVQF
jgi:TonB-linked SusC/RagA family outer membrane protein